MGNEGDGPTQGNPLKIDTVVAGRNPVAVDRVCLQAMGINQRVVQHLHYAARLAMGPHDTSNVDVVGDTLEETPFQLPNDLPPIVEYPKIIPSYFQRDRGISALVVYGIGETCQIKLVIIRQSELSPVVKNVRTLYDWTRVNKGLNSTFWDGRDENGQRVPPGNYAAQIQAKYGSGRRTAFATGKVWVV